MQGRLALDPPTAWTVAALTARIAAVLRADPELADCTVRGEISNWRRYGGSGHCYFTLKDAEAELRCVMFRREAETLRFEPSDGMAVQADGRVDVYEKRGEVQLYVRAMRHDGLGALYEAFERLKAKLAAEGLFDEARKRPLPRYPRRVAVITSPSGAAVRDMCRILHQRWPSVRVLLVPAVVQGAEAAASLVSALERVNRVGGVEVILFGRGGGSIEDLWAFCEEPVARAVAASAIPVISAVGHETDFTISDFVADVRAATPTHAAQMAVPDAAEEARKLTAQSRRLGAALSGRLAMLRQQSAAAAARLHLARPERQLALRQQATDDAGQRLDRALTGRLREARHRLDGLAGRLAALDPGSVLQRGYAILFRESDGAVVRSPAMLPAGAGGRVRTAGGELLVTARGEAG